MTTQVTTGRARFSYCNVAQARRNEMSGKDEFSTQVLIPKTDTETIAALKAAACCSRAMCRCGSPGTAALRWIAF